MAKQGKQKGEKTMKEETNFSKMQKLSNYNFQTTMTLYLLNPKNKLINSYIYNNFY